MRSTLREQRPAARAQTARSIRAQADQLAGPVKFFQAKMLRRRVGAPRGHRRCRQIAGRVARYAGGIGQAWPVRRPGFAARRQTRGISPRSHLPSDAYDLRLPSVSRRSQGVLAVDHLIFGVFAKKRFTLPVLGAIVCAHSGVCNGRSLNMHIAVQWPRQSGDRACALAGQFDGEPWETALQVSFRWRTAFNDDCVVGTAQVQNADKG